GLPERQSAELGLFRTAVIMKSLKNIIVATDFNDSSVNVLDNAIHLAQAFKSKVTLKHEDAFEIAMTT
ncbi:MAG TPA: hypothetical protein PLE71_16255, partial [Flavobacteriales bacterium]|nr:hypothetical protein [Flavobacteriales bacterium]